MNRKEVGDAGEARAAEWLATRGYRVVCRQYRTQLGEIDLVCEEGTELVFVEVKTRRKSTRFGYPEETITRQKVLRLLKAGYAYLREHHMPDRAFRLEAVLVEGVPPKEIITHISSLDAGVDAW
ncbi:YraN family protein [Candidatus Uhrbacteria bacterium]|nr:YraN family protein [Candidatus Uhrbacteria bacterium]